MYVKYKLIEEMDKEHHFPRWVENSEGVDMSESRNAPADYYRLTDTDIDNFTPKKEKDRKAKALKEQGGQTLDSFFEDDTSENSTD